MTPSPRLVPPTHPFACNSNRISSIASAALSIGKAAFGLGEAELGLRAPIGLIKNIRKSGKDMKAVLGLDASLSAFEGRVLPGVKAEVTLQNYPFLTWFDLLGLKYLGSSTIGISWNYSAALERLPYADQLMIYYKGGGGYY